MKFWINSQETGYSFFTCRLQNWKWNGLYIFAVSIDPSAQTKISSILYHLSSNLSICRPSWKVKTQSIQSVLYFTFTIMKFFHLRAVPRHYKCYCKHVFWKTPLFQFPLDYHNLECINTSGEENNSRFPTSSSDTSLVWINLASWTVWSPWSSLASLYHLPGVTFQVPDVPSASLTWDLTQRLSQLPNSVNIFQK